jgi:hypothetical protein
MNTKSNSPSSICCHATICSPSLESLKGLKGLEYRKAWNKLFKEKCRAAQKAYRERNPEKCRDALRAWLSKSGFQYYKDLHKKNLAKYGVAKCTYISRQSEKKATMARQPWGVVEDEILTCGKYTEYELVDKLGRSIRAIQRRKWRLRQEDSQENA